jgi:hypothetical protein
LGGVRRGWLAPVVELALQKKRQAKQPVVQIQKPESAVAVMLLISRYFYATREDEQKTSGRVFDRNKSIFEYFYFLACDVVWSDRGGY